ncbi:MAG: adenylosuccinate synthase [Chloroflexota bacterium]
MPLDMVLGAQWGDEGKGRITDLLAREADIVVRFSGGDNAGHTVTVGDQTFKLHLIPSGIINPDAVCIIGNGVVLNPEVFLREMDGLAERGVSVSPDRLKIARNTHLITPAHRALDRAKELFRGKGALGTTLRGIGPAYLDKVGRKGLRAHLFEQPERLADEVYAHIEAHNKTLIDQYKVAPLDAQKIAAEFVEYGKKLAPHLVDGHVLIFDALRAGKQVLAEGAQGTMLDIDHGTYPFVTSSSPTAGGVLTGIGIGPKEVNQIWGVAKAFSSRVGAGPFPTELEGDQAVRLRGTGANPWDEFGTTTGRPRRVGWLDLVILKHAVVINSLTHLCLTKLDILSGIPELPICVGYEVDGTRYDHLQVDLEVQEASKPIYETLPGWEMDVTQARTFADLPVEARRYIEFVSDYLKLPIDLASVGPERDQIARKET